MSKGPLILWLVMELGCPYLAPAASEVTVRGFWGQSVTLPCQYSSWSQSNSMCWGKGQCPNSKCNQAILHTDGARVTSRTSARYRLQGNIQRGEVSLTILNTVGGDSGVYCCRIEVPGWFNDVKKNIRLVLSRAPTTTVRTTTSRPTTTVRTTTSRPTTTVWTTTSRPTTMFRTTTFRPTTTPPMTTTTVVLPTTVKTTPDLTTRAALQTRPTSVLTTVATTCPLRMPSSLPETAPGLLTTETITEGPTLTQESETFLRSSDSRRSTEVTSADSVWLTSEEQTDQRPLLLIVASCLGFVLLLALLLALLLRGKVTKSNCLQKHERPQDSGESTTVLSDMQHGRDDEDGLFTL